MSCWRKTRTTHRVHGLVKDSRLDVVLALQKAGEDLHLEPLRDAVGSNPFEAGLLPLFLTHALAHTLHIPDTPVSLITVLELFLVFRN